MMSVGPRKREISRAVRPVMEQTVMTFAPMSMAMPHVAWLMASSVSWISNCVLGKRLA